MIEKIIELDNNDDLYLSGSKDFNLLISIFNYTMIFFSTSGDFQYFSGDIF